MIIGQIEASEENVNLIYTMMRSTELMCASDGSHSPLHKLSTHSYIIHEPTSGIEITGVGQTPGHPELLSSYRAELHGQAAIYLLIFAILQYKGNQPIYRIDSFTDNKEASRQITYLYENDPFSTFSLSNPPEADILTEIRYVFTQLTFTQRTSGCTWIRSHQDQRTAFSNLSPAAQLNVRMDTLASEYLQLLIAQDSIPIYAPYPHNQITVYHHHQPVHTHLDPHIRDSISQSKLQDHIRGVRSFENW